MELKNQRRKGRENRITNSKKYSAQQDFDQYITDIQRSKMIQVNKKVENKKKP